ncbi:CYTH domain-containing protein [Halalkalibacterium ligniniphilum]|uniref:CYTH domain-containing protein n=1 Tax=Halalkalibacterium ligniniphilum TaxID=1134413 RepID=UPI0003455BEA|nr:CYTH domain-containing protein [Halalkalibacterium ligniniphilum]
MNQEIEIERKTLVTKETFERLLSTLGLQDHDFVLQHNHYFETTDGQLRSCGAALRIREKNGKHTLTLKEPHKEGLLETHQALSKEEVITVKTSGTLPDGDVKKQLHKLGIDTTALELLGTLSTERAEQAYEGGILCLDKSFYFDVVDYEIEFEGNNQEHANKSFSSFLDAHNIAKIPTENKIRRFFARKMSIHNKEG